MAFKDVRDLAEHLKQLDYPHRFNISTLYTPHGCEANFHVVAEILQWLCERLQPGATLLGSAHSVPDRVMLIRSAAEFFVTKSAIRLNPRRLYASNATTAGELLKVTTLLMQSPQHLDENEDNDDNSLDSSEPADLSDKIHELRRVRELSSELTNAGAALFDNLAKELTNKETRNQQATRSLELATVEKNLKEAIQSMTQKVQTARHQLETKKAERNILVSKVDRKSAELERVRQRLEALQKIRPAFLEEFERHEIELKSLFDQYIIRVRCLDSLRAHIANRVKMPNEVQLPVVNALDNSIPFLPDGLIDSDEELIDGDDDDELRIPDMTTTDRRKPMTTNGGDDISTTGESGSTMREARRSAVKRLRVQTATQRGGGDRRFVGNMMGGSDLDSSLGSEDDGSEHDSENGLGDKLSDDDGDDVRLDAGETLSRTRAVDLSDEDF